MQVFLDGHRCPGVDPKAAEAATDFDRPEAVGRIVTRFPRKNRSRRVPALALLVVNGLLFPFTASATASGEAMFAPHARDLTERAVALEHGEGVPQNLEQAAELYCEAARLGDPEAMYSLGWIYANGRGLPRNDANANALFRLAAERGNDHAGRMVKLVREEAPVLPACMTIPPSLFAVRQLSLDERIRRLSPQRREMARLIVDLAPQYDISPVLALAIAITESALDPAAVSPKNAMGLMQLIPETAARFNVRDAFDPEQNIRGGLSYLRWLLAYFEGDVQLAAAAYNAGEGAVERYRGVPPFPETKAYVQRIQWFTGSPAHPYDGTLVRPSAMFSQVSNPE